MLTPPEPMPEPPAPIEVMPLPEPTAAGIGDTEAETSLRGPLWSGTGPAGLEGLLARLPDQARLPSLRRLQRLLLQAPGPAGGDPAVFTARVEKLIDMGEPDAAAALAALAPAGEAPVARIDAALAADQLEPLCTALENVPPERRNALALVCAAVDKDPDRVELAVSLAAEAGSPLDPSLIDLARATATGQRLTLKSPSAGSAPTLPLLARAPLALDPDLAASSAPAARRVLGTNPNVAAGVRDAARGPEAPAPKPLPGPDGLRPDLLPIWAALTEASGGEVPAALWPEVGAGKGTLPSLFYWRGLEAARAGGTRGEVLLFALLLLDGAPENAAPVTLHAALGGLRQIGLADEAREIAMATAPLVGL